jgi:hypothetical protein
VLFASSAFVQFDATVPGTVTDPAGAAVQLAAVKLSNVATGISVNATTDGDGAYGPRKEPE